MGVAVRCAAGGRPAGSYSAELGGYVTQRRVEAATGAGFISRCSSDLYESGVSTPVRFRGAPSYGETDGPPNAATRAPGLFCRALGGHLLLTLHLSLHELFAALH